MPQCPRHPPHQSFKNREQFGESEARSQGVPGSSHPWGQKGRRGGREARVPWVRGWASRAHSPAGPRCGPWAPRAQGRAGPVWGPRAPLVCEQTLLTGAGALALPGGWPPCTL